MPRDAATVVLVRDGADGPELYLMRRPGSMAFAAGMYVFPGGSVDDRDNDLPLAASADLSELARRGSTAAPRALLAAAVRETFEECGVLLAVDVDGRPAAGGPASAADRSDLDDGRLTIADLLALRGLVLDPTLLTLTAHWITPAVQDRRFDTRFFLAVLPEGQEPAETGAESDGSGWWTPRRALLEHGAGSLPMMLPTVTMLRWLQAWPDAAAAVQASAAERVRPLLPAPRPDGSAGIRWALVDGRTGMELTAAEAGAMAAALRRDDLPPGAAGGDRP